MIQLQNSADLSWACILFFYANHTGLRAYESKTSISTIFPRCFCFSPSKVLQTGWLVCGDLILPSWSLKARKPVVSWRTFPYSLPHPAYHCCSPSAFYLPPTPKPPPSPHHCHPQTSRSGPFCKVHELLHYFFH